LFQTYGTACKLFSLHRKFGTVSSTFLKISHYPDTISASSEATMQNSSKVFAIKPLGDGCERNPTATYRAYAIKR
jgi:hypothetical protein